MRPKHNGHNIQNKISNWFCWKKIFDLWLTNSSLEFVQLCNIAAIHPCVYSWLKNATFKKRWMQSRWYWLSSCQLVLVCSCMYICHWNKLFCALACSMVSTMSLSELMYIYNSLKKTSYKTNYCIKIIRKVMFWIQKVFLVVLPENSGFVCYMVLLATIAQQGDHCVSRLADGVRQPTCGCVCLIPGPCHTTVPWRCRKNFSQWECSFHWKLRCHWLEFLWQRQISVVRQGPVTLEGTGSLWQQQSIRLSTQTMLMIIHHIQWGSQYVDGFACCL